MSQDMPPNAVITPPNLPANLVDESLVRFDPSNNLVYTKYTLVNGSTVELAMHRFHARQYSADLALCTVQSYREVAR